MRTTVTLDPDVEALLRTEMRERRLPFKAALNEAIRAGLGVAKPRRAKRFKMKTYRMGFEPRLPWDKALQLAGNLEDEEIVRKLQIRK